MGLRFTTVGALALLLAACGETDTTDASPYAAGDQDAARTNAGEDAAADAAEPAVEDDPASEAEDGPSELDMTARAACTAGDAGFADALPEGAGFASRGADARVHAAWRLDGETGEQIVHTPSLPEEARLAFDGAVADFLRRNMTAGFDRTGLTGAYRARDGRFCVVQTEAEAVEALRAAVQAAEAAAPASDG